ncbi:hypothetical protein, partial [Pseudoruminococcus massiliensis]|uniref:hypothetical protein n=1 Tax=Pseudoruminococcus massiliensis TaxID=2086583 RepID=UPI003FD85A3A
MFGFGERKIKINQLPEEKTETKPQSETEQKLTYTEKETENKDNSHDIKSYKQLSELLIAFYIMAIILIFRFFCCIFKLLLSFTLRFSFCFFFRKLVNFN